VPKNLAILLFYFGIQTHAHAKGQVTFDDAYTVRIVGKHGDLRRSEPIGFEMRVNAADRTALSRAWG